MVDERLPGGTSYNPIYDAQGDVIGLLNSSGALVQSIRYGPTGRTPPRAAAPHTAPQTTPSSSKADTTEPVKSIETLGR
jgi:hypothetical protein